MLDRDKHYWFDETEVEKLLRKGDGWLSEHPEAKFITQRYLGRSRTLVAQALQQIWPSDIDDESADFEEEQIEKPLSLNAQRVNTVRDAVLAAKPSSVVDLGCGDGKLMLALAKEPQIDRLLGVDVSTQALKIAKRRLKLEQRSQHQKPSVELRQSALTYRDRRLLDFDVACLVEVIEHVDLPRLEAIENVLFGYLGPRCVIVTTPNSEYNQVFGMEMGSLRHSDHRFEWTRQEFITWCEKVSEAHGYSYGISPIGPVDESAGSPTQMGTFTKREASR